jgi:hypothetical protein
MTVYKNVYTDDDLPLWLEAWTANYYRLLEYIQDTPVPEIILHCEIESLDDTHVSFTIDPPDTPASNYFFVEYEIIRDESHDKPFADILLNSNSIYPGTLIRTVGDPQSNYCVKEYGPPLDGARMVRKILKRVAVALRGSTGHIEAARANIERWNPPPATPRSLDFLLAGRIPIIMTLIETAVINRGIRAATDFLLESEADYELRNPSVYRVIQSKSGRLRVGNINENKNYIDHPHAMPRYPQENIADQSLRTRINVRLLRGLSIAGRGIIAGANATFSPQRIAAARDDFREELKTHRRAP